MILADISHDDGSSGAKRLRGHNGRICGVGAGGGGGGGGPATKSHFPVGQQRKRDC